METKRQLVIHYIFLSIHAIFVSKRFRGIIMMKTNERVVKVRMKVLLPTTEGGVPMKTKMKTLLMSLCAALIMLAGSGVAVHAEESTFHYAYDVQRDPAFLDKTGDIMACSGLAKPIISDSTRGNSNQGDWKLIKIGFYGALDETIREDVQNNTDWVVSRVAADTGLDKNVVCIHELKDGDTHIAYGVIVASDESKELVVFIGNDAGNGYLLSQTEIQERSVQVKADKSASDYAADGPVVTPGQGQPTATPAPEQPTATPAPEQPAATPEPSDNDSSDDNDDDTVQETVAATPAPEVLYTVQKGDTLSKIARINGCSLRELMEANADLLQYRTLIYPNWVLKIPKNGTLPVEVQNAPVSVTTKLYKVQKGDSLWKIARNNKCTVKEIINLNNITAEKADLIYPGWELSLPEK